MNTKHHPILDPDGKLHTRVARIKSDFLANRYDRYLEMVRQLEDHPENQDGADKTWVAQALEQYRQHFQHAVRIR